MVRVRVQVRVRLQWNDHKRGGPDGLGLELGLGLGIREGRPMGLAQQLDEGAPGQGSRVLGWTHSRSSEVQGGTG